jgi:hypothetical protein
VNDDLILLGWGGESTESVIKNEGEGWRMEREVERGEVG